MDKRKSKHIRKIKRSISKKNSSGEGNIDYKFLNENCVIIILTPHTQHYIGCVIGEKITAEHPWALINKEKIDILLYEDDEDSEFYPYKKKILEYCEEQMLIGSFATSNKYRDEEFFICLTVEEKNNILNDIEQEKILRTLRVNKLIYCKPQPWITQGSEMEIDSGQNVNLRKLFEMIFDVDMPMFTEQRIVFTFRFATLNSEDENTYVEIPPDLRSRQINSIVYRRRVDKAIQKAQLGVNTSSQTLSIIPINKHTQTDEVFKVKEIPEMECSKLNISLESKLEFLEDKLLVNYHINLNEIGYMFPNAFYMKYASHSKELLFFQDMVNCKDLFYCSSSWNPLISGLVAVSYVQRPLKMKTKYNSAINFIENKHMVVLWCYTDNLMPKLFLHVNFDVTCISFCPHDENILVGGGSGGQIVVWDIQNKLQQVEVKEFLTSAEENHRNIIRSHTKWLKWPTGVRHVYPTIISNMAVSHRSPVISIEWIPSYQYMTNLGHIENTRDHSDNSTINLWNQLKRYQFLSCSAEDSIILAWEIKKSSNKEKRLESRRRKKRLSRMPEGLIEGVSPLIKYNRNFKPFFKLKLLKPGAEQGVIITNFKLNNPVIKYKAINPQTLKDFKERTFFREIVPENPQEHTQKFVISSALGFLLKCSWKENSFDQGLEINQQVCDFKKLLAIHDGPVTSCVENPFIQECFLTCGGFVFCIWIKSDDESPIFWRKGHHRYITALWLTDQPLFINAFREDNYVELWDIINHTNGPIRVTKLKGSHILDVITDTTKTQARKGTFLITDLKGSLKVQDVPKYEPKNNERSSLDLFTTCVKFFNNLAKKKDEIRQWTDRLKLMHCISVDISPLKTSVIQLEETFEPSISKPVTKRTKLTFHEKEQHRKFVTLLQQKRIDISELSRNIIPLQATMKERLKQKIKLAQHFTMQDEIFQIHRRFVLDDCKVKRKSKYSVSYSKELVDQIKQQYIEDYKNMEEYTLNNIRNTNHNSVPNWKYILNKRMAQYMKKVNRRRSDTKDEMTEYEILY